MPTDWTAAVRRNREAKDDSFRTDPHSPIPPDEREDFDGLAYYPVTDAFRFDLPLHEHDDPETLTVPTGTGGAREYLRWGAFRFEVDAEAVSLQVYKGDPDDDRLWVPFRDATSGEETYGAGRYLDLEADPHRTDDRAWILDFNAAYNPICAYSDRYECPLPPTENWPDVAIEAGRKPPRRRRYA